MKILIIGGTTFIGPHLIDCSLSRGHSVTMFTRGKKPLYRPDETDSIQGDREHDMDKACGQEWDCIIDTCAYLPGTVKKSTHALKGRTKQYVFISTVAVYSDLGRELTDEDAPLHTMEDETVTDINLSTYGPLKVLCEREVLKEFPHAFIVRPGLIAGPKDPTDRFTYWVVRGGLGRPFIAPEKTAQPFQAIDVRDLSDFIIHGIESNISGIYNCTGPREPITMDEMIEKCTEVLGGKSRPVWIEEQVLLEHGLKPGADLPLWTKKNDSWRGIDRISSQKAVKDGLKHHRLEETIIDTWNWVQEEGTAQKLKYGLSLEREEEILKKINKITID